MSNGEQIAKLKAYFEETRSDKILKTLQLAGFDDRVIDYISNGIWSKQQAIIGLDLSGRYPVKSSG